MIEKKKEYLSQYLIQQAKINRLNELILNIPDQTEKWKAQISEAKQFRNDIETKIQNLNNAVLSELLFQKYMCGKSILEISYSLNYSERHTERLYKKALEQLEL